MKLKNAKKLTFSFNELDTTSEKIAQLINNSSAKIILLSGNLGSGKTTLITHIVNKLGYTGETNSPTFQLINQYAINNSEIIYHLDLYRLKSIEEALEIGIEDILFQEVSYVFIEWAEIIIPLLKGIKVINIHLSSKDKLSRELTIKEIDYTRY